MKIIFKTNETTSNFDYCSSLFKGKNVLNGFNKLEEGLCELIDDNQFEVQNIFFGKELKATLYLDYPLKVVIQEEIKFSSLHELITEIRNAYSKIYKTPNKYGVWGHWIWDLVIEAIKLYEDPVTKKVLVDVSMGS